MEPLGSYCDSILASKISFRLRGRCYRSAIFLERLKKKGPKQPTIEREPEVSSPNPCAPHFISIV